MFWEMTRILWRGTQANMVYWHVLPQRRSVWFGTEDDFPPLPVVGNVYFSIHPSAKIPPVNADGEVCPPERVRSQIRFVSAINCLFAEYDVKDYGSEQAIVDHLDALVVPPPSVLIHSGGGVHAYWLLTEPIDILTDETRDVVRHIQSSWVGVVRGDNGAKDLTRVLRVPDTLNYKYDPPREVRWIRCDLDRLHAINSLTAHIPPIITRPEPRPSTTRRAKTIEQFNEANNIVTMLEQFGYKSCGRTRMLSPYSSTGTPGVHIHTDKNRAYVFHGSDPLNTGHLVSPFDVVCKLQHNNDFHAALAAIRERT